MSDDIDAVRAEVAYLRLRELALKEELERQSALLGIPAVTEETVGAVLDGVVEALRHSGNAALASKFESAYWTFTEALQRCEVAPEAGLIDEAARGAMNDALEHMERVEAEVSAWFDAGRE